MLKKSRSVNSINKSVVTIAEKIRDDNRQAPSTRSDVVLGSEARG